MNLEERRRRRRKRRRLRIAEEEGWEKTAERRKRRKSFGTLGYKYGFGAGSLLDYAYEQSEDFSTQDGVCLIPVILITQPICMRQIC